MSFDQAPIYLIPGMTAEYPVFARLAPLLANATVVHYTAPKPGESLVEYAARMSKRFSAESFIVGVSFGGIVALESARIVCPRGCVLISSVRHPRQLPPWFRMWRHLGPRGRTTMLRMVGACATLLPKPLRPRSIARTTRFAGPVGQWHRWAASAVVGWQPSSEPIGSPVLHIHGDADTTFPIRYTTPDISIPEGRHALPVTHPVETANAIAAFVRSAEPNRLET